MNLTHKNLNVSMNTLNTCTHLDVMRKRAVGNLSDLMRDTQNGSKNPNEESAKV